VFQPYPIIKLIDMKAISRIGADYIAPHPWKSTKLCKQNIWVFL